MSNDVFTKCKWSPFPADDKDGCAGAVIYLGGLNLTTLSWICIYPRPELEPCEGGAVVAYAQGFKNDPNTFSTLTVPVATGERSAFYDSGNLVPDTLTDSVLCIF